MSQAGLTEIADDRERKGMLDWPEDLQLLTEEEAARLLRISVKRLQNQRWRGTGPKCVKPGAKVLYRLSDLRAYLDAMTVAPQPPQPGS